MIQPVQVETTCTTGTIPYEQSIELGIGTGIATASGKFGQKGELYICSGCEGSTNDVQFSEITRSIGPANVKEIEEKKYGQVVNEYREVNYLNFSIRAIVGFEIKVGLPVEK